MRPILIDTNAYVAFKRGDEAVLEVIRHAATIALSPVVLGELIGGFDCGTQAKKNREELTQFLSSSRIRIFPVTADTSVFYGQVYASLRNKGKPIPSNDIWIAAQALENGCVVCTYDRHFQEINGLIAGASLPELML